MPVYSKKMACLSTKHIKTALALPRRLTSTRVARCNATTNNGPNIMDGVAMSVCTILATVGAAHADIVLPPLDTSDPNRCSAVFDAIEVGKGATRTGQVTTAVSGKVLDARQCNLKDAQLPSKVLSGALFDDTNLSGADLKESRLSKSIARNADFSSVDFSDGLVDRIDFRNTNLRGSNFYNAIVTGTNFDGADLGQTNFEYALFGKEDIKRVCQNPTLEEDSREQIGCPY